MSPIILRGHFWTLLLTFLVQEAIAQDLPERPNELDGEDNRTGDWILYYDSATNRVNTPDSASNYILASFKNGRPIGRSEMFYKSGTRQWIGFLYDFDSLKIHGKATHYYPNGNIETEVFWNRGIKDGSHTEYHQNGMLGATGAWKNDKETGYWEFNYSNGNLMTKGRFENGNRVGIWETGNENGTLRSKGLFVNGKEEGYWEYYFDTGNLESKGVLKNGEYHGKWVFHHENGNLKSEDFYNEGAKNGLSTFYHPNGKIHGKSMHKNGDQTGPYEDYYVSGNLRSKGYLEKGLWEGYWVFYHDNENIEKEGVFEKDKEIGIWKFYREDGALEQLATMDQGVWEGPATFYHENGKIKGQGNFRNDERDGPWVFYNEDGNLLQKVSYKEGIFHGPYEYYRADGLLIQKGKNVEDKKEGEWVFYYENGTLSTTGFYKDDQQHGFFKKYYENGLLKNEGRRELGLNEGHWKFYNDLGQLTNEGPYARDLRHGEWKFYYPEIGRINAQGMYENGKSVGVWKYYFPDGTLKSEGEEFDDNKRGEWTFYHENGKLESKGSYINNKAHGEYLRFDTLGNYIKTDHYWYDVIQNFSALYDSTFKVVRAGKFKESRIIYKKALKKFKENWSKEMLKYSDLYVFKADYQDEFRKFASEKKQKKIIEKSKSGYRKALDHIKKFKPDTSTWFIRVQNGLAYLDFDDEEYESAAATYKKGLELIKQRPDWDVIKLYGTTLRNLADCYHNSNRSDEAVELLLEELEFRKAKNNDPKTILETYASLVDVAWGMDSLQFCIAMADSVITRANSGGFMDHWALPEAYFNKGRSFDKLSLSDSSDANFSKCILAYQNQNDSSSSYFGYSLLQLGYSKQNQLELKESGSFYTRALESCQRTNNTGWLWRRVIEALASQYWDEKNYELSAQTRRLSLKLESELVDPDLGNLSNTYAGLGLVLGELGPDYYAEAEENYLNALKTLENYGYYHWAYASAMNNYAFFLINKKRDLETAENVLYSFLEYDKKFNSPNAEYLARNYFHLSNVKQDQYQYDSSIFYAGKAMELLEPNPQIDVQTLMEAYTMTADCHQNLGDLQLSVQYNFKALELIEEQYGTENTFYSSILTYIGTDFESDDNYATSLQYLKQALALDEKLFSNKSRKYLSTLNGYGRVLSLSGEPERAIKVLEEAKVGLEDIELGETSLYLSNLEDLASAYEDAKLVGKATEINIRIERLARRIYGEDHELYYRCRRTLGKFYLRQKDYDLAYKHAKPAYDHAARALSGSLREAWYAETMAVIHFKLQEYTQAAEYRERAAEIYKTTSGEGEDYMTNQFSLAEVYRQLGQYQNAIDAYVFCNDWVIENSGAFSFRLTHSVKELSTTYRLAGRPKESLKMLHRLKDLYDSINVGEHYYVALNQLYGLTMISMDSTIAARRYFEKAKSQAISIWKEDAYLDGIHHNMAKTYLIEGNLEKAEDLWTNTGIDYESKTMSDLIFYYDDIASLYTAKNDLKSAEGYWDQMLDHILEQVKSDFTRLSESGKAAFWDTYRGNFENYNTFALKSFEAGDKKAIGRMYDNNLHTKGILLSTTTRERSRILNSGDTTLINTYYRYNNLKEDLARYYGFTKAQLADQNINIDGLEQQVGRMERIMSLDSDGLNDENKIREASWRTVQRSLKKGEAAIEIIRFRYLDRVQTDSVLYAALILTEETKNSPKLLVLSNGNELETKHIKAYKSSVQFKLNDTRSYEQFWKQIDAELAGISHVHLSPDGVFNQLNISTLKRPNGQYLMDAYGISLMTSTRDLVLTKKERKKANLTAHVFGFPTYDLAHEHIENILVERSISRSGNTERAIDLERFGFNELPGTKVETEEITGILDRNNWITNLHLAERALEEDLKMVSNPTLLHIATHGFFLDDVGKKEGLELGVRAEVSRENPLLRSGLLMTGAAQTAKGENLAGIENGIFTAYEAMNLNLNETELVVLSACETGRGEIKNGEGVYGLQRAFQIAGADAILMSLWKVDDSATQLLMTEFYQNWISGSSKVESLRYAQEKVREQFNHPYYWGAFVLVGG